MGSSQLTMLHKLFKKHSKSFHATYKTEIAHKFVKVSLDLSKGSSLISSVEDDATTTGELMTAPAAVAGGSNNSEKATANTGFDVPAADDSDDDAALEAMLDAES